MPANKTTRILVQFRINRVVKKKLDRLAKATARKTGPYLERLVECHVKALSPTLARALSDRPLVPVKRSL